MLGFSACNPFNHSTPEMYGVVMYGPGPSPGFRIHGVVTADEKPVEGIRISVQAVVKEKPHTVVSVKTGVDGKYVANWTYVDLESLTLIVEDIDGEENGGEFATQTRELPLTDANMWTYTEGRMTAVIDIELVKKTDEKAENGNESE